MNEGVIDLQLKYPDVVGWLAITGAQIDCPIAWRANYTPGFASNVDPGLVGKLIMDYRCERDFTSRNTVLYDHTKSGGMFDALKAFVDKDFFDKNPCGTIFLPRDNLTLEFFAYMVVKSTEKNIYSTGLDLEYVKQHARQYRDVELAGGDRFVTLSTCAYEFDGARMVLLARII